MQITWSSTTPVVKATNDRNTKYHAQQHDTHNHTRVSSSAASDGYKRPHTHTHTHTNTQTHRHTRTALTAQPHLLSIDVFDALSTNLTAEAHAVRHFLEHLANTHNKPEFRHWTINFNAAADMERQVGTVDCGIYIATVSYTLLRAHEPVLDLFCRLLLE